MNRVYGDVVRPSSSSLGVSLPQTLSSLKVADLHSGSGNAGMRPAWIAVSTKMGPSVSVLQRAN